MSVDLPMPGGPAKPITVRCRCAGRARGRAPSPRGRRLTSEMARRQQRVVAGDQALGDVCCRCFLGGGHGRGQVGGGDGGASSRRARRRTNPTGGGSRRRVRLRAAPARPGSAASGSPPARRHSISRASEPADHARDLPRHRELVYASGVAEIAGGLGTAVPALRSPWARWWLVAVLIAIFPANVHCALHPEVVGGGRVATAVAWARLPFQAVFVAWVLSATREQS